MRIFQISTFLLGSVKCGWVEIYSQDTTQFTDKWATEWCKSKDDCTHTEDTNNWIDFSKIPATGPYTFKLVYTPENGPSTSMSHGNSFYHNIVEWTQTNNLFETTPGTVSDIAWSGGPTSALEQDCFDGLRLFDGGHTYVSKFGNYGNLAASGYSCYGFMIGIKNAGLVAGHITVGTGTLRASKVQMFIQQEENLAAKNCPNSKCWSWNAAAAKCELVPSGGDCVYELTCDAEEIIIDFTSALLARTDLGDYNEPATCLDEMATLAEPNTGIFKFTSKLGDCSMDVSKGTTGDIVFTKTISVGRGTFTQIGGKNVYLDNAGGVTVTFTCQYGSTATLSTGPIDIATPVDVTGAVTVDTGAFDTGLELDFYTNNNFDVKQTGTAIIGGDMFAQVKWLVTTLTGKVGFFVKSCSIIDVSTPATTSDTGILIVDNACYASVVSAKPFGDKFGQVDGANQVARIEYKSFSYNTGGIDKQKLACEIVFCVITNGTPDCFTGMNTDQANCPTTGGYNYQV